MSDLPICDVTDEDVDDCHCLDYDERDADDEREQQALDERTATFECDHCHEERPIAERETVAFEVWCTTCVDHFDLTEED